jgi:hypothetical protein
MTPRGGLRVHLVWSQEGWGRVIPVFWDRAAPVAVLFEGLGRAILFCLVRGMNG